ncbi:MAG: DNA-3-methyladenine glycosylase 2 family protein [Geminicoccaceae bacterium]
MIRPLDEPRLRADLDRLASIDADVASAMARIGYPSPRVRDPGFATLLRIIVGQQVSTRSAAAIWARLEQATEGPPTPDQFLGLDDEALRAVGFSRAKVHYGRHLAEAVLGETLALDALHALDPDAATAQLTALPGFGRWSAEIYLLFALGHGDIMPADDLALQVAYERLKGLPARPTAKLLRELTTAWSPVRGAGAVFLWHYYGAATLDPR